MAAASHPVFMKDATVKLTFGAGPAVDFQCEAREAAVVPEAGKVVTYVPLCPDASYSQVGADTFTLKLKGVQDWSANGLARLLWDHAGEDVPFELNVYGGANSADTPAMVGVAIATRPTYGGEAEAYAEFDLELPITGVPTLDVTA